MAPDELRDLRQAVRERPAPRRFGGLPGDGVEIQRREARLTRESGGEGGFSRAGISEDDDFRHGIHQGMMSFAGLKEGRPYFPSSCRTPERAGTPSIAQAARSPSQKKTGPAPLSGPRI